MGVVALAATGVGAVVGATAAASIGIAGVSIATIATVAGVAAGVLSLAATLSQPKPTVGGNATKFKIDKEAGIPIVFGRTFVGGNVVHRQYYGTKNSLESWVTALSIGPVKSVGPLLVDKAEVTFIGGAASGTYNGFMWLDTQLGACPEQRALAGPQGAIPGWDASSKLSGIAADLWTLKFDAKQKGIYPNGVPQRGRVVEGVFAWDPRLDSTVAGGSGLCRQNDPSTWPWTENPWLLALQFALGYVQNGVLMAGGGLPVTGIDLVRFIEAANYADLVGWKAGGLVYTTADAGWDVLKMLAQAGGGEVMPIGALLSCTFSAPRVSIGTIRSEDIAGDIDLPTTASIRTRRNTVIPKVRLESHGWEVVPLDAISVAQYVGEDRAMRPREIELPLVQDVDQGAQLSVLKMLDDRELDGIVLPLKVYALGYLPGDALDTDVPEADLTGRQVVVRTREIDAATLGVTLTCRTETPGKHEFALGRSGVPPRTPDLSIPEVYPSPVEQALADLQAARAAHQIVAQTVAYPVTTTATSISVVAFRATLDDGRMVDLPAGQIDGLDDAASYRLFYALEDVVPSFTGPEGQGFAGPEGQSFGGIIPAGTYYAAAADSLVEASNPAFVIIRLATTANADGATYPPAETPPAGDSGSGYGGGGRYQQNVAIQ